MNSPSRLDSHRSNHSVHRRGRKGKSAESAEKSGNTAGFRCAPLRHLRVLCGEISLPSFVYFFLLSFFSACSHSQPDARLTFTSNQFAQSQWNQIVEAARGSTVNFGMWAGDAARNTFYQSTVAQALREQYGITLRLVPNSDVAEVINKLLNEKSAGKMAGGLIDLVWINGENFRTARQGGVLWGPFADRLPNIKYFDEAARARDFGTPTEGYEAPFERAQFVLACDTARTPEPPRSIPALREWIKAHPGRFTYIAPPDFTGSVFIRHVLLYYLRQAAPNFDGRFDETLYRQAANATFDYLNEINPHLWRGGATYPVSTQEADRLFANSEIDFTMSYGPSFAAERIARGQYPPTVHTFVFDEGTIGNYSFLAVPFNAANKAGALVVINHLLSYEHKLAQSRALGSLFPLRLTALTDAQRAEVEALPRSEATLPLAELAAHQLAEPDATYVDRLEQDWKVRVLQR